MESHRYPGLLDSLSPIRRRVGRAATEAGLGEREAYKLCLAVDEIATNIITHGYEEAGLEGDILVRIDRDDQTLTVYLEDSGLPYDPLAMPLPDDLEAPLQERHAGGLGIFLAVQSVDSFHYEKVDKLNRHVLVMNRPRAS